MLRKKLLSLLEMLDFLPLASFLILYKIKASWPICFSIAGSLGLFFMLVHFLFLKKKLSPPFLLGINLFLTGGLFMVLFNIGWLIFLYQNLKQAMFFASITLVALAATVFEPRAFLNTCEVETSVARKLSLVMFVGCVAATAFAFCFKGDFFYSGFLPFLFLLFLKDGIQICDYSFKKKLLMVFGANFLLLFVSFVGKNIIGQSGFISIVALLVGKKALRSYFKKVF